MMGKRFARIVEECLHRLDRGENLPDVLVDYPAEAEQLKPLLLVAMASRSMAVPIPNPAARIQGRAQMLSEMDQAGLPGNLARRGIQAQVQSWFDKLVNASRSRGLLRPTTTPSYRMALIALVVIFGSGWFVVSASASPGEFFKAFTEDIQQMLALFERDPGDTLPDYLKLINIYDGGSSPLSINRAAKVVFLQDILVEEGGPVRSQYPNSLTGGSSSPDQPKPQSTPSPSTTEEIPEDVGDDPQGPGELPVPIPHPASSVVNEVVSDTAKEKNPVWDQLPFNQSGEEDEGEQVSEDQAEEEEDCDPEADECVEDDAEDDDGDEFEVDEDEFEEEETDE